MPHCNNSTLISKMWKSSFATPKSSLENSWLNSDNKYKPPRLEKMTWGNKKIYSCCCFFFFGNQDFKDFTTGKMNTLQLKSKVSHPVAQKCHHHDIVKSECMLHIKHKTKYFMKFRINKNIQSPAMENLVSNTNEHSA